MPLRFLPINVGVALRFYRVPLEYWTSDWQMDDYRSVAVSYTHLDVYKRQGEAFASVETTLTWGKGLSLEQMADQEQAEQTERNEQAKTSAENDASETGADEASALSAPPAPPVPPTQTEPPTPPEPPVPPAPSDENPEDTKEHD